MVEEHTWLRQSAWNQKDEYYTPSILVDAIIPYLKTNPNTFDIPPEKLTIWCPFDTENSGVCHPFERSRVQSHLYTYLARSRLFQL